MARRLQFFDQSALHPLSNGPLVFLSGLLNSGFHFCFDA